MLNACRHQRSVHVTVGIPGGDCEFVLNACRHQRSVHVRFRQPGVRLALVLNACRHQRSVHVLYKQRTDKLGKCSTPVGIKDRFTRSERPRVPGVPRAQRLSASKIGSPIIIVSNENLSRVLNACRHQRSVHPGVQLGPDPAASAQRLSASKIGSRGGCIPIGVIRSVLNACRHQRSVHPSTIPSLAIARQCSTPVGIKDRFTTVGREGSNRCQECSTPVGIKDRFTCRRFFGRLPLACAQRLSASKIGSRSPVVNSRYFFEVLNACRHQRSVHACSRRLMPERTRCSTPVGIKDRFTHRRDREHRLLRVLNACRHQRSVHLLRSASDASWAACSTPVGIKDRFTYAGCMKSTYR